MEAVLTEQDKDFVREVVKTGSKGKAARKAYGLTDIKYANVKGTRLMEKDVIIKAVEEERISLKEALIKQGVTPEKIANKVDQLLEDEDAGIVDKGLKHATAIYGIQEQGGGNSYTQINVFNAEMKKTTQVFEEQIKKQLGYAEDDKEI